MARIAAILVLSAAGTLAAQDDPFETRIYNVEFMTKPIQDHPGIDLNLAQDAIGTTITAGEMSTARIDGESIIALIRNNIAEDSWEHVKTETTFKDGVLTVTNLRSVHARIAQYLSYWRGFYGKMIAVDSLVLSVDPEYLANLRAAGRPERPAVLPGEHLTKLLETAREGKLATLIATMRVTAHPGQRVNMANVSRRNYVRDHDIQLSSGALALDPVIDVLISGVSIDVRPHLEPFMNAITLETRISRAVPTGFAERPLRLPRQGMSMWPGDNADKDRAPDNRAVPPVRRFIETPKIQLPKLSHDRFRTTLTIGNGETAIVGSTFRNGRNVLYLLRPAVIALDEKAAPAPVFDEDRLLRLYDVSPLTRPVQDFAGPRLELVSPYARGGPLTGATFTLDEPAVRFEMEHLIEMIRHRIAPETWGNRRNTIHETGEGTLVVRQRPEVLREIDRFLNGLITARAQMITTEAVLIGIKKSARAEWDQKLPALRPGGYFVKKEEFDALLKEAYKGETIRLVETGEVTSFPQQRVHGARLEQESYLQDYEPQVSTAMGQFDPIVGILASGFVFDVRPHFIVGTDRIALDLQADRREYALKEEAGVTQDAGPLQSASGSGFARRSDVMCKENHWTLVGIETKGSGDAAEDVALFIRARANILK